MAAKNVSIPEPTINDFRTLTVEFSGGTVTSVDCTAIIATPDPEVTHTGSCTHVAADFTAGEIANMGAIAEVALAKLVADKNFPA